MSAFMKACCSREFFLLGGLKMRDASFEIHRNPDDLILRVFCCKCVCLIWILPGWHKLKNQDLLEDQVNCPYHCDNTFFCNFGGKQIAGRSNSSNNGFFHLIIQLPKLLGHSELLRDCATVGWSDEDCQSPGSPGNVSKWPQEHQN